MKLVLRGPRTFKSTLDHKTMCYTPRKRPEMAESRVFYDFVKLVLRGPGPFKSYRTPKSCAIAHENGQKYPKS